MIKKLLILAVVPFMTFCAKPEPPMIVPKPVSVELQSGSFVFSPDVKINYNCDEQLANVALYLSEYVDGILGYFLEIVQPELPEGEAEGIAGDSIEKMIDGKVVNLVIDERLAKEEYQLWVDKKNIHITGGSAQSVLYGVQSLRQMLVQYKKGDEAVIPAMKINDKPSFEYRGMHLDVARHFFTVDEVKKYIDILAMHKINTFHWHLTEDQGWRIEIKKYPELTKVGAYRDQTLIGHGRYEPFEYDGKRYGGFYTQDEVRDVVKYAQDRFITVIPEIEMPGHALAALASYNWLGCQDLKYKVAERWGVFDEVYCAGKETTFEFLEGVLTEVLELFPSKFIHIGGDECPKVIWKKCPYCQARIKKEKLANEDELQSYFVRRIEKWLNERGRSLIGWDEILEGGLSKTATVMSWRGTKGGIEAAKLGNMVIMTPYTYVYFDYYQTKDTDNEPMAIGGYLPVEKVYEFDPYEGLDENECKYIWGVQANVWTEYIKTMSHAEYMLLPRLAALTETAWAYGRKDYADFVKRMSILRELYALQGYNYAKFMFEPAVLTEEVKEEGQ